MVGFAPVNGTTREDKIMSENAEIITGTGTTEKADVDKSKSLFDPKTPHEKAIAKYLTDTMRQRR